MKGRSIILGQIRGRSAAALLIDGLLHDLLVDPETDTPRPGAIYRATADRPMKGQGGVFVRLPHGSGFLRQTSGIAPGATLLVQVTGPTEPGKATPVTARLLFKSRYAILTPDAPGRNISRRIKDENLRSALDAIADREMTGAALSLGLILRSICQDADESDIAADIRTMRDLAETVLADLKGGPELLVDGALAHETAWRDWSDPAPDTVEDDPDAMAASGALDQIDGLLTPRVDLPGAGHMMIEATRAVLAVDVNTGADTSPAAALKANIAAARDLPRQLRLRGLGGQIVIDFAPMPKRDRAVLDQVLRAAFKGEAAETSLVGWTGLGLYELVRKRDRLPLTEVLA